MIFGRPGDRAVGEDLFALASTGLFRASVHGRERFVMAARRSTAVIIAVTAAVCPLVFAGVDQAGAERGMPAGAVAAAVGGTWHTAVRVPGTATLNAGGAAWTVSVSCASAGNCNAGGGYTDSSGHRQAFVITQS
jgi:hypothetical protein